MRDKKEEEKSEKITASNAFGRRLSLERDPFTYD